MKYVIKKADALFLQAQNPPRQRRLWLDKVRGAQNVAGGTCEIPPGSNNPFHSHTSEEVMFIYKGTGIVRFDDSTEQLEPETLVWVPPGINHQFVNDGTEDLCFVYFYVPAGPEAGFREQVAKQQEEAQAQKPAKR